MMRWLRWLYVRWHDRRDSSAVMQTWRKPAGTYDSAKASAGRRRPALAFARWKAARRHQRKPNRKATVSRIEEGRAR